jgi:hypothetical protein
MFKINNLPGQWFKTMPGQVFYFLEWLLNLLSGNYNFLGPLYVAIGKL